MSDRATAAVIVSSALALLIMGWCLTRATGAVVIGTPPAAVAVAEPPRGTVDHAGMDLGTRAVPGRGDGALAVIPDAHPVARSLVARVLEREREQPEPRSWSMRAIADPVPSSPEAPVAVILVRTDSAVPPGHLAAASVGAGRATAPWLRRALQVAGAAVGRPVTPQTGWAELHARAGVGALPGLGPYVRGPGRGWRRLRNIGAPKSAPVPAIALRVGVDAEAGMAVPHAAALPVLAALVDQLQTEAALPPYQADRFALGPGKFLTPHATRWLWVFPLVPLTVGTGARYARLARHPEFGRALSPVFRRLLWWCVPCVGGAAVLVAWPVGPGRPMSAGAAVGWMLGVAALSLFARARCRRVPVDDRAAALGGALSLDLLWSTYLFALVLRPWGAGAWLGAAVLLWPWVMPAAGLPRAGAAVSWCVGAAPAAYWLTHLPAPGEGGLRATLGWLAGDAPPWAVVLGGFAATAGLRLAWRAATVRPMPLTAPAPEGL